MPREVECGADGFARGISDLLGDVPGACAEGSAEAVAQSVRRTAKKLRSGAFGKSGRHEWSDEYMGGFSSHVEKGAMTASGEVGNKAKPGLVHLLEKGHATLTGRRTAAFPHMAPAFDDMSEDFAGRVLRCIGEALR